MQYLRGNAPASAVGLFVICRYLSAFADGLSEEDLRRSLQVLRASDDSSDEGAAVLVASLAVGEGLRLIAREHAASPWTVDEQIAKNLSADGNCWPWFRSELLFRVAQHGVRELESQGTAPDLVRGLTWFLQLNPLSPLQRDWGRGPERIVEKLNFDAVARSDQWRPFQRWAVALGLARPSDTGEAKVLIPDATTAIAGQLASLPANGTAHDWLSALRKRLPILGSPTLLAALPKGGPAWDELPAGAVLGLLKLEKAGVLSLEASDDASNVVSIGLGSFTRQFGRISVRSK